MFVYKRVCFVSQGFSYVIDVWRQNKFYSTFYSFFVLNKLIFL